MEESKKLEIISGDGNELEISEVRTHISASKPKIEEKKNKKIIIPKDENNQ